MPVKVTSSVSARMKHSFYPQHLQSARHFAKLARQIEESRSPSEISEEERSEHRSYVTGAIVFSAAYLETSINELYLDASEFNADSLMGLPVEHMALLGKLWPVVERAEVLKKYEVALTACGKGIFERGREPFQGTDALIKTRNALIHYRPEWDDNLRDHRSLQERLNGRFALSPYSGSTHLWFPHQCLSADCASWAVTQVEMYVTDFCTKLGIPSRVPNMN